VQGCTVLLESLFIESVDGTRHRYSIVDLDVVDARRASLSLDTDESILSLVTCYPFDAREPGGTLRYVVTARKDAGVGADAIATVSTGTPPGS